MEEETMLGKIVHEREMEKMGWGLYRLETLVGRLENATSGLVPSWNMDELQTEIIELLDSVGGLIGRYEDMYDGIVPKHGKPGYDPIEERERYRKVRASFERQTRV